MHAWRGVGYGLRLAWSQLVHASHAAPRHQRAYIGKHANRASARAVHVVDRPATSARRGADDSALAAKPPCWSMHASFITRFIRTARPSGATHCAPTVGAQAVEVDHTDTSDGSMAPHALPSETRAACKPSDMAHGGWLLATAAVALLHLLLHPLAPQAGLCWPRGHLCASPCHQSW